MRGKISSLVTEGRMPTQYARVIRRCIQENLQQSGKNAREVYEQVICTLVALEREYNQPLDKMYRIDLSHSD